MELPARATVATDDYRFTIGTTVAHLVNKPTEVGAQLSERLLRTVRVASTPNYLDLVM